VLIPEKQLDNVVITACALGILALAGCSSVPSMPRAPANPAPDSGYIADLPQYRLQIGDVLDVKLPLTPELNDEVTIRPDGRISTAFVRDALAYNRTVPELSTVLRDNYSHELRNPVVSVIVKSFAPYRIYVAGEVTSPGEYITEGPNLTLSQAIARAGGMKIAGDSAKVFILRRGPNDVPEVFSTNYRGVLRGADPSADVRLARFDVVFVPRTSIAEVYIFFNQYLQQFVPVSWGFSYLVGNSSATSVVQAPAATH
jgi:protein involved in polysaccharide export with SLBB domain